MSAHHPLDLHERDTLIPFSSSKRHRRPSVRLGEIGDQTIATVSSDPSSRRPKLSKLQSCRKSSAKSRVTVRRARTNWNSRIEDGFDLDLKSSDGEETREDYCAEDSCDRSDHRNSTRIKVLNGGDDLSEERLRGWAGDVRSWLDGLGLGQYAPVFEIHEVDDEVLPMLTLEDLRDMGINAVGSRRKLHCAILKLSGSRVS